MDFIIEPYQHQKEALELSKVSSSLALLWEMGTGKTGAIINILRYKYNQERRILRTLILGPPSVMYNWKDEFGKFSRIKQDEINIVNKSGKARCNLFIKSVAKGNIIVTNWEALRNADLYELISVWGPEIIVGDEMHLIKTHNSQRAKAAVKLADQVRRNNGTIFGLTGTLIANSIEDVWMQFRFLDGGKRFGTSFWQFRPRYMIDMNAGWNPNPGQRRFSKWVPRQDMFEELNDKISSISTRVTKEDCLQDLPPLVRTTRKVEMSPEQKRLYKQMEKDFIAILNNAEANHEPRAAVATLAVTKGAKLNQIASGFVIDEYGEPYVIKKNPKLEVTKDLLTELTPNHKVILWCSYKVNYKQLGDLCDSMELPWVLIKGGQSAEERHEAVTAFQTDEKVRVIIANRGAGGTGINLTAASYSIVFSRNFSLTEEKQSEARNHRGGSQIHSKITKIDLVAQETIEFTVLQALRNKQKVADAVVDYIKEK